MPLVGSSFREHVRAREVVEPPATPDGGPRSWWTPKVRVLVLAVAMLVGLMTLEWFVHLEYSLGIFYVFPIIAAATVLSRSELIVAACVTALLRGTFTTVPTLIEYWLRFAMATIAYAGVGLLVIEVTQRRSRLVDALERLREEQARRFRAEDNLRLLAESSPAGIVTLGATGDVLSVNHAFVEMIGFSAPGEVTGRAIQEQVPVLASALRRSPSDRPMRASTTSWARRVNGQLFPITLWFSTYGEGPSRCLAGIVVDTSEEVRDREREAFRHFLDYNRLLAGAVTHEIRNMCSAIRVVTTNLARRQDLQDDADFRALSSLVDGLGQIAAFELRDGAVSAARGTTDLHQVLDQLRVVIEPDWTDLEASIRWNLADETFRVPADPHALLQVFLNLTQNSLRACQDREAPTLDIWARREQAVVVVSVIDDGPGVRDPGILFHPFRPDADGSGLGLYISRALVRSYGGDLRFVPREHGCRFDVVLPCEPLPSTPA